MRIATVQTVFRVGIAGTLAIGLVPIGLFGLGHIVDTELALERQVLDRRQLHEARGEDTRREDLVEALHLGHGVRIAEGLDADTAGADVLAVIGRVVAAILVVSREDRRHDHRLAGQTGRSEDATVTGSIDSLGEAVAVGRAQADLQPLVHLGGDVGLDAITVILVTDDDTAVVSVVGGSIVLGLVATAGDGHGMVLDHAVLEDEITPLGADRVALGVGHQVESLVTVRVLAAADGDLIRTDEVENSLVLIFDIGVGIHHLEHLGRLGETDTHIIGDLGLALAALLGGDEDDAARSTGTVQRGGSRILEDLDGGDVGRVDVRKGVGLGVGVGDHAGSDRNAIHDVQRIRTGGDGADATDEDLGLGTGAAARRRHLHTGSLTLQHGVEADVRGILEQIGLDGGNGSRHRLGTLGTVSHDDDILESLRIGTQGDVDRVAAFDGDLLVQITDGGDDERRSGGSGDGVCTLCIRSNTGQRAFDLHGSERNRFTGGSILDRTLDGDVLREKRHTHEYEQSAEEQFCFFHKHLH